MTHRRLVILSSVQTRAPHGEVLLAADRVIRRLGLRKLRPDGVGDAEDVELAVGGGDDETEIENDAPVFVHRDAVDRLGRDAISRVGVDALRVVRVHRLVALRELPEQVDLPKQERCLEGILDRKKYPDSLAGNRRRLNAVVGHGAEDGL